MTNKKIKENVFCLFISLFFVLQINAQNYYVSASGSDSNNGTSPSAPFKTIQKAANIVNPGDIVYVMNGIYTNPCPSCDVVTITRAGTPTAWITFTTYPGHKPKLKFNGWHGFQIKGPAAYIEISGFEIEGNNANVTLEQALAQSTTNPDPRFNGGGIGIDGRGTTNKPHHIRILNNKVYNCGGGGIGGIHTDYVTVIGNEVFNTSWYTIYATSGISFWQAWNYDNNTTDYKIIITNNKVYNNKTQVPWVAIGKLSDGNGIIIDDSKNTQSGSTGQPYRGRFLVALLTLMLLVLVLMYLSAILLLLSLSVYLCMYLLVY